MIDVHTHILPGIDDGSPDLDTSLKMLKIMKDCGVTDIFATSHFIEGEYDNNIEVINKGCSALVAEAVKNGIPINIHCGSELYLSTNLLEKVDLSQYCLGKSDYILVESALTGFPDNILDMLYRLVKKGYKPILAHPERYSDIIKKPKMAEDLLYRNVYLQVNAGSFFGFYGEAVARTVWDLFHDGFVHFIASDTHCRSADYTLYHAKEMLGEQYPDYPTYLFTENNPQKILNNENIEYFNPPVREIKNKKDTFFSKLFRLFYE